MSDVLTVRLGPDVKASFAAYCAGPGHDAERPDPERRDRAARRAGRPESAPPVRAVDGPDDGPKRAVRVWLTPTEHEAVDRHVAHAGGSRAGWIVRAVRAALTREPELGAEELRVLGESNRELLAIGRNLNQIARRLNERQERQAQAITVGLVEELQGRDRPARDRGAPGDAREPRAVDPPMSDVVDEWAGRLFGRRGKDVALAPASKVSRTPDSRGTLRRTVSRAPEVMVKITGNGRNMRQVKASAVYISRKGAVPLEDERGDTYLGPDAADDALATWAAGGQGVPTTGERRARVVQHHRVDAGGRGPGVGDASGAGVRGWRVPEPRLPDGRARRHRAPARAPAREGLRARRAAAEPDGRPTCSGGAKASPRRSASRASRRTRRGGRRGAW